MKLKISENNCPTWLFFTGRLNKYLRVVSGYLSDQPYHLLDARGSNCIFWYTCFLKPMVEDNVNARDGSSVSSCGMVSHTLFSDISFLFQNQTRLGCKTIVPVQACKEEVCEGWKTGRQTSQILRRVLTHPQHNSFGRQWNLIKLKFNGTWKGI